MLIPSFTSSQVGEWHVLAVQGELDMATAPMLRQQLMALAARGAASIVLDLDGVEFIDSTGLGVIVGGLKRTRTANGELRVVCSSTHLLGLFEITRLDEVLEIYQDVAAATDTASEAEPERDE